MHYKLYKDIHYDRETFILIMKFCLIIFKEPSKINHECQKHFQRKNCSLEIIFLSLSKIMTDK